MDDGELVVGVVQLAADEQPVAGDVSHAAKQAAYYPQPTAGIRRLRSARVTPRCCCFQHQYFIVDIMCESSLK